LQTCVARCDDLQLPERAVPGHEGDELSEKAAPRRA
jgi:hypothetical protein